MAYGDYGAYVWRNGVNISDECCDTPWCYEKTETGYRWIHLPFEDRLDDSEDETRLSSHALVPVGDRILLNFYKTSLSIHWGRKNGAIYVENVNVEKEIIDSSEYSKKGLTIFGYRLNDWIQVYYVDYEQEHFCIIIGGGFGKGYDNHCLSKLLRKETKYNEEMGTYNLPIEYNDYKIEYYARKDDRRDEWFMLKHFGLKPLLRNLITFKFKNVLFHAEVIKLHLQNIRYLL